MGNWPRHLPVTWFVILAVVASCAPTESAPPQQPSPPSPPSETTPPRVEPTATQTPTTVWGLSPADLVDHVVFSGDPPAWLSDPGSGFPAVDVLAVAMGPFVLCGTSEPYQLMFLNAETGDRFDMTVPSASGMLWLDSHTFGLFWKTAGILLSIDFADRSVEATSFEAEWIHRLMGTEPLYDEDVGGCMMNAMHLAPDGASSAEGAEFIYPPAYSADLSLFVTGDASGTVLEVRQTGTDALIWSSDPDPDDDTSESETAWSPVEPLHLAVVECEADGTGFCVRRRLYVVDAARGEELASYPGEFLDIAWSPDGSRILYISPEEDLGIGIGFYGPPCVLDLGTGENECFQEVPAAHFPDDLGIEVKRLYDLQWDRGGEGFYYAYHALYPARDDLGTPGGLFDLAGLCHYDLVIREVSCPSDGVPELEGFGTMGTAGYMPFWFDYELSPDESFAYVQASGGASNAHGVLNMQDRRFFRLPDPPESGCEGLYCFVSALWRPSFGATGELDPTAVPLPVNTSRPTEEDMREIPSIWASYNLEDDLTLVAPGTQRFSVQVSPDDAFTWPFYWCALGEERLAANLESIAVEFTIDGGEVPSTDILEFDTSSQEWECHYWATMLSGWETGSPISLVVRFGLSRGVSDGRDSYPPGDYSFEVLAAVLNP